MIESVAQPQLSLKPEVCIQAAASALALDPLPLRDATQPAPRRLHNRPRRRHIKPHLAIRPLILLPLPSLTPTTEASEPQDQQVFSRPDDVEFSAAAEGHWRLGRLRGPGTERELQKRDKLDQLERIYGFQTDHLDHAS